MKDTDKIIQCINCKFCRYSKYKDNILYSCTKDKDLFELNKRDLLENKPCFHEKSNKEK